ncbi:oligosaccharide flippase family protein [Paucibacter sp. Y2R2-4]|uniref:oligosaccharide flippase family protein n=1 Tax=Paucibacter sp. Y2R2-4 TaxID=2893553 RepID=UPI0021E3B074|nr:oligosaccharide flippase family protein [Paucibacter sp. Y2R2-4]MCV2349730.1 oligosaccharide flippase family protein [Paucibacter sp. Y2R2-4]
MIASTPLLTRIFSPDAFGIMAVFSSTYAIAIPIATMKYDAAVILPKSDQSAIRLTALVILIASSLSILTGVILWLSTTLSLLPHAAELNLWLPLALWLGSLYTLTQQWSARRNNYKHFARSQIIGATFNIGTSLGLGIWLGGRPEYLIFGFVFGMASSLGYMYLSQSRGPTIPIRLSIKNLIHRAIVYKQFPTLVLPTTLLITFSQSAIPLILTANYPIADVGHFAVANRLLLVPSALIGGALTEVFRAEFVRRQRNRTEVTTLFQRTLRTLAFFAFPLFGTLTALAPLLFSKVFGVEYQGAGQVAQAIALGVAAQFLGSPFASVFVALRRADTGLKIQLATTGVPLVFLAAAATNHLPLNSALLIYSATSALSIAAMLVLVLRMCRGADNSPRTSETA